MRFTRMMIVSLAIAMAAGAAFLARVAYAQGAQGAKATINDPIGPPPDPTHIPTVLPKDLKWTGQEGRMQQAVLFGDPSKPGLYGVIIKWYPGNFSQPHIFKIIESQHLPLHFRKFFQTRFDETGDFAAKGPV